MLFNFRLVEHDRDGFNSFELCYFVIMEKEVANIKSIPPVKIGGWNIKA